MKRYLAEAKLVVREQSPIFPREVAISRLALGWDVHRKFSKVSLQEMTAEGQIHVSERARLEHYDRQAMRQWLGRVPAGTPVALEAAFGWPWIADLLEEVGLEPHLGHPPAIKVLAENEAKSDRCDADRPAKFQLRGILPEIYLAPPKNALLLFGEHNLGCLARHDLPPCSNTET